MPATSRPDQFRCALWCVDLCGSWETGTSEIRFGGRMGVSEGVQQVVVAVLLIGMEGYMLASVTPRPDTPAVGPETPGKTDEVSLNSSLSLSTLT